MRNLVKSEKKHESVGEMLRFWRRLNRISQMDLALDIDISPKHLSFVETGKSKPSRDLVLKIAHSLKLPFRHRNAFFDPNVLGGLLVLIATLTAAQLLTPRPLLRRSLLAGILLVDGLCLYLTYSRGSMAGFALGLGILALVRHRRLIPGMAAVALLLLLLPQTQEYVRHFVEGLQQQDPATKMRLGEYKDALLLIGRHPWIGVGFVSTPEASLYIGVSNVYLLIAEEMGFIGLAAFLVVLRRVLRPGSPCLGVA